MSVMDKIEVHMYKLTPKKGVNILDAKSSKDKTTAPVKNINNKNLLKWFFSKTFYFIPEIFFVLLLSLFSSFFHSWQ